MFDADLSELEVKEPVHSLTEEELDSLNKRYYELKSLIDNTDYELTIQDQRDLVHWRRAFRETKFILNATKAKVAKEKVVRIKKPKKLSKKALGILLIQEMNLPEGEILPLEDRRNMKYTLDMINGVEYEDILE